ncbi:hypothetical protein ONZ45_g3032 [Pleurotus djamor]|nr:hypothetical protein ONZ45_g3032 [Pleurotus djamor]
MMLRSLTINSPVDDHEDTHLRRLLDQRAAHAPFHARYPSVSEFTDTPSVYSHPFFSPRPMAFSDHDARRGYQNNWSSAPSHLRRDHDGIDDLATSMLDLDDDSSVSMEFQDDGDEGGIYQDTEGEEGEEEEEEESMPRMSLLGPKMRFHSKAPWEVDETLQEEDIADKNSHPVSTLKKTFKLGSSSSGRTSDESNRSQSKSKSSLDILTPQIPNARAALNALTQTNPSTSTLVSSTHSPSSKRRNLSNPQSPTSYHTPSPPPSPHDLAHPSMSNSHTRHDSHTDTHPLMRIHSNVSSHTASSYHRGEESYHPYANPDFAVTYTRSHPPHDSSLLSAFGAPSVSHSESVNTLTDSSTADPLDGRHPLSAVPETPDISIHHREIRPRKRSSTVQGREISSPMTTRVAPEIPLVPSSPVFPKVSQPHHPPAFANIPGWLDRPASPSFALISLEEARAQRSRSATVNHGPGTPSRLAQSSSESDVDQDTISVLHSIDHSSIDTTASRSRARSVSAGTKAKQALQSMVGSTGPKYERRESEPTIHPLPGTGQSNKPLKHKKSGFMKFFNKDKEAPPVPSLSESLSSYQIHQPVTKTSKFSTHRIPVPQLSPGSEVDPTENLDHPTVTVDDAPLLYISTARGVAQLKSAPSSSLSPTDWQGETFPQSAPAHVTEFPALKLRPVSTVFSSHFRDHIVPPSPQLDGDSLSPASAATVISPVTPSPARSPLPSHTKSRTNDSASIRSFNEQDNPDAVIKALQEQIVSAKQAWQRQIWELEGQVRDLKAEVEELRSTANEPGYCDSCGRGPAKPVYSGVINRPRAYTGSSARFGSSFA